MFDRVYTVFRFSLTGGFSHYDMDCVHGKFIILFLLQVNTDDLRLWILNEIKEDRSYESCNDDKQFP